MVKEYKPELKEKLLSGEWQEEPDFIEYRDEETKYRIRIFRQSMGFLCGYVRVPISHRWYGRFYASSIHKDARLPTEEEIEEERKRIIALFPDFPGMWELKKDSFSITYIHDEETETIQGAIDVHGGITYSGDSDKNFSWEFGFDCGHLGDLIPTPSYLPHLTEETYRNIEYVKKQCEKLAKQLKKYE